jgi:hypothetical protein
MVLVLSEWIAEESEKLLVTIRTETEELIAALRAELRALKRRAL